MSVLKAHRSESKAEYLNVANKIYIQTINFLTRLSSRYARLLAGDTASLAFTVSSNVEMANSIYNSDLQRLELRKEHLLEAKAALSALDVHLSHCYSIMLMNPAGCFNMPSGGSVSATEAQKKLDHMAQELGELIDKTC